MKLLIVKTSALGDIIHTFPVLAYLRQKFPKAQIDWVVEKRNAELLEAHPEIDHVLTIESKKWPKTLFAAHLRKDRYDVVFDLQGNCKSAAVLAQVRAKKRVGFGRKSVAEWPNLLLTSTKINPPKERNIRDDYLAVVQGYYKDNTPFVSPPVELISDPIDVKKEACLVCPGAAWPNKRLGDAQLIHALKQTEGPFLFAWGTDEERIRAAKLAAAVEGDVLPKLSLPKLQNVMRQCRLVIAMDSLPLHLCGTTHTPSLSFFGPSMASKYAPLGDHHMTVQGMCPYGLTFEKRCPRLRTCQTGRCLNDA